MIGKGLIIGGPTAYKVFQNRRTGIRTALHWVNSEPAMVLYSGRAGTTGFVICLSAMHKYATRAGGPTPYLIEQAARAAQLMGLEVTKGTIRAVADEILEHVVDVVKMPPMPDALRKAGGKPVGTMTVIANGTKVAEAEVLDLPPDVEGMTAH